MEAHGTFMGGYTNIFFNVNCGMGGLADFKASLLKIIKKQISFFRINMRKQVEDIDSMATTLWT